MIAMLIGAGRYPHVAPGVYERYVDYPVSGFDRTGRWDWKGYERMSTPQGAIVCRPGSAVSLLDMH